MSSRIAPAAFAAAAILVPPRALAHGFAGPHMFISTLLLDDPNVADEASLPTFTWLRQAPDDGPPPTAYGLDVEFDKRITENLGFAVGQGYHWLHTPGADTVSGWGNVEATLKYKAYVNPEHEFMLSIGVSREFSRTGATGGRGVALDNDDTSSTAPTLYWGKGFGDLPIGMLRPLALTGQLAYRFADRRLKQVGTDPVSGDPQFNSGMANQWEGGLSLQYSFRYLSSQVKDFGLPEWINRLTPVVEFAWSTPATTPHLSSAEYLFGVGMNYTAQTYGFGIEALIPGNRQTGRGIGVVAQFHLYFDDLLPNSLGRPLLAMFR